MGFGPGGQDHALAPVPAGHPGVHPDGGFNRAGATGRHDDLAEFFRIPAFREVPLDPPGDAREPLHAKGELGGDQLPTSFRGRRYFYSPLCVCSLRALSMISENHHISLARSLTLARS